MRTVRHGLKPHGWAIIKNPVKTGCAVKNFLEPLAPFMGVGANKFSRGVCMTVVVLTTTKDESRTTITGKSLQFWTLFSGCQGTFPG